MKVFITGMAGTLGTALAVEHKKRGDKVVGCSRNELNCLKWRERYPDYGELIVADAFDLAFWNTSVWLDGVQRVYHCAAMKHIDVCEQQPTEAIKQNIELTAAVSAICKSRRVCIVLASTDKACRADSVYGASKLLAERIVLNTGGTVVRLGNLIGSSGSVFQTWKRQVERGESITLTDPEMTRWFITVKDAARFMMVAQEGRSWPDGMKAAKMGDVAATMTSNIKVIGLRPGETRHQWITDDCSSEHAERWNTSELLREAGV